MQLEVNIDQLHMSLKQILSTTEKVKGELEVHITELTEELQRRTEIAVAEQAKVIAREVALKENEKEIQPLKKEMEHRVKEKEEEMGKVNKQLREAVDLVKTTRESELKATHHLKLRIEVYKLCQLITRSATPSSSVPPPPRTSSNPSFD